MEKPLFDDLVQSLKEARAIARRKAIESAKANNALSGFQPSPFGLAVFEKWINGDHTAQEAVDAIRAHYSANAYSDGASDMQATPNKLGLTDSRQLHQFEADVTTIRMAELEIDGI